MAGNADKVVTARRQSLRLHREIAHSELRLLGGLGHMIHYFAHDEIVEAIEATAARIVSRPFGNNFPRMLTTIGIAVKTPVSGSGNDLRAEARSGLR